MNNTKPSKINWFLFLRLLGIIVFIILLFKIDLPMVWKSLKMVSIPYLLLAIAFQVILLLIKGVRWHILKKGKLNDTRLMFNMGTFLESYAVGVVTPGRVGEFLKAGHEENKEEKWASVFKVVAERGYDVGIFILMAGLATWYFQLLPLHTYITLGIILVGAALIVLSLVLLSQNRIKSLLKKYIKGFFKKDRQYSFDNFNLNRQQSIFVFSLSVLGNAATFLSCYLLAEGISLGSSFLFTSGGVAVAGLLNLLPITIMGMGTREISFLYIFSDFNQSSVMAFSFLMFLVLQVGGGLISLFLGQLLLFINKKHG